MASIVTQIASIMRGFGQAKNNPEWEKAAKLQDLWLTFSKHVTNPIPPERFDYSAIAWPNQTGVTMEWILKHNVDTDGRAKTALGILQGLVVTDPKGEVKATIQKQVNRLFAATSANAVPIGDIKWASGMDLKAFHAQRVEFSAVETDLVNTPLDPLLGSLGSFNFYAVPVGRAQKLGDGTVRVDIQDFVFYVVDSFDFEGFQPLGFFAPPDSISKTPIAGGTLVSNSTYRDYRDSPEANGKGGDFLVLSDAKTVPLPRTFSFTPEPTINGTWASSDPKRRFVVAINGNTVDWTEVGLETGMVYKASFKVTQQGDAWRIERPNKDVAVLKMLGFQDPTLQQAILSHDPHPSFLIIKIQNAQLAAKWSGIRVKKTPQGKFQSLVQPEDPAYPPTDYSFVRMV